MSFGSITQAEAVVFTYTLVIIPVMKYISYLLVAIGHYILTIFLGLVWFGYGMEAFDMGVQPFGLVYFSLDILVKVLMFPFALLNNEITLFRGSLGYLAFIADSLLWSWTIIYIYQRFRNKKSISVSK